MIKMPDLIPETDFLKAFRKANKKVAKAVVGASFKENDFKRYYLPLIKSYIADREQKGIETYCIGIGAGNAVGKSSFAKLIAFILEELGFKAVAVSIDDFYKSAAERKALAKQFAGNPFYQISRGMPGTHRIKLLESVLKKARKGKSLELPVFDKSAKKGFGEISRRGKKVGKIDFFILEGVWIGIPVINANTLMKIIGKNYAVKKIAKELKLTKKDLEIPLRFLKKYEKVFGLLDNQTIMVPEKAEWIIKWRTEEEKRLRKFTGKGMSREKTIEFVKLWMPFVIMYNYFYLQKHKKAEAVIVIGKMHRVKKIITK